MSKKLKRQDDIVPKKRSTGLSFSITMSFLPILEEIAYERNTVDVDHEDLTNQKMLKAPDSDLEQREL